MSEKSSAVTWFGRDRPVAPSNARRGWNKGAHEIWRDHFSHLKEQASFFSRSHFYYFNCSWALQRPLITVSVFEVLVVRENAWGCESSFIAARSFNSAFEFKRQSHSPAAGPLCLHMTNEPHQNPLGLLIGRSRYSFGPELKEPSRAVQAWKHPESEMIQSGKNLFGRGSRKSSHVWTQNCCNFIRTKQSATWISRLRSGAFWDTITRRTSLHVCETSPYACLNSMR